MGSGGAPCATSWKDRLSRIRPQDHLVDLYEDDASLTDRVSHYLREGLEQDEAVVAIASAPHRDAFACRLSEDRIDVDRALGEGRLTLLEAEETMAGFMVGGRPDPHLFRETVGGLLEGIGARGPRGLRAYGEMVDILWSRGNLAGAISLEGLWHELIRDRDFPLLCAYRMGVLDPSFDPKEFQSVLAVHSDRVPGGGQEILVGALDRAMEDVLGKDKLQALRPLIRSVQHLRGVLSAPEAAVLWLSQALPARLNEILTRARTYYSRFGETVEPV